LQASYLRLGSLNTIFVMTVNSTPHRGQLVIHSTTRITSPRWVV